LILNFWATWCGPCLEKLPTVLSIARRYEGQIRVVNVAYHERREYAITWLERIERGPEAYLLDEDGSVGRSLKVVALPSFVVLEPDMTVAAACDSCSYSYFTIEEVKLALRADGLVKR